jgi:hypothetical protein
MKTFLTTLCMSVLSMGTALSLAHATPGDAHDESRVLILESTKHACTARGGICFYAGASTTVSEPSAAAAALGTHPAAGLSPSFGRVGAVAARGQRADADDAIPWVVEVNAALRHKALAGNVVFLIYDGEHGKAVSTHEVLGAWQAKIPAGEHLTARLTLNPDDGFRPGRTYRIRVVQILRGKEHTLTDGTVRLL